jgi:hypothetical protein
VAEELRRHGHDVAVPSLVAAARSGRWKAYVDAVVAAAPAVPAVVVAHSGAGPFLPEIGRQLNPSPSRLVFVDATLPPTTGSSPLVPEQFLEGLRSLAQDGVLPPWSEWFEPGTMEKLLPEAGRREAVLAELPRLPLSFFDARVPVPEGWASAACAYILLSDAYRHEADEAAARSWPVTELLGSHLDLVAQPLRLARTLAGQHPTDNVPTG